MMSPRKFKKILVTGGAGFIGSAFIRTLLQKNKVEKIVNLDLLSYSGNLKNLKSLENDPRHLFIRGDILNRPLVEELIRTHEIEAVVHFAAESHVDRSIENPHLFYRTNVEGTIALLDVVRLFPHVHFHHISTDEVFGSIEEGEFEENFPYHPNSPYAASKAASDHFVRSYAHTYGLSVTLSHSSNNYGPCQYREKFIPRMIDACLHEKPLPVYGTGMNVRDWLFVEDHAEAIWIILQQGRRGESYNVGGGKELKNLDLLHLLIDRVALAINQSSQKYKERITFVPDRQGHDFRYALKSDKLKNEMGWMPHCPFEEGIDQTIQWYVHGQ